MITELVSDDNNSYKLPLIKLVETKNRVNIGTIHTLIDQKHLVYPDIPSNWEKLLHLRWQLVLE